MSAWAVILAAGRSSRMGVPKALMRLDGEPLVVRVSGEALAGGVARVVLVVGAEAPRPGQAGALATRVAVEPLLGEVLGAHCEITVGAPDASPLDSLRAGLSRVPAGHDVLVWPVDHPFADRAVVARLLAATRVGCIVVPGIEGRRGHPVLFSSDVRPELERGELPEGARSIVRRDAARVLVVEADDPRIVMDLDSPEDAVRLGVELSG